MRFLFYMKLLQFIPFNTQYTNNSKSTWSFNTQYTNNSKSTWSFNTQYTNNSKSTWSLQRI